jgi:hypothetical protein
LEARIQELSSTSITTTTTTTTNRDNLTSQSTVENNIVEELRRINRELERQLNEWRTRTDGIVLSLSPSLDYDLNGEV